MLDRVRAAHTEGTETIDDIVVGGDGMIRSVTFGGSTDSQPIGYQFSVGLDSPGDPIPD